MTEFLREVLNGDVNKEERTLEEGKLPSFDGWVLPLANEFLLSVVAHSFFGVRTRFLGLKD